MNSSRKELAQQGLDKAIQIRLDNGLGVNSGISIYDLCEKLGLNLKFVDINMEGLYAQGNPPKIWISSQRPFSRRAFTCAHELGHHVFGHGSTIDELNQEIEGESVFEPDEFLVDCFAGSLLMPIIALRRAFSLRKWNIADPTPEQMFIVACSMGVGYETLISHCAFGLQLIRPAQATNLRQTRTPAIRATLLNEKRLEPLLYVDSNWLLPTIDTEVGTLLFLPAGSEVSCPMLSPESSRSEGRLFKVVKPGLGELTIGGSNQKIYLRVSRSHYVGLSKFRHLEDDDE